MLASLRSRSDLAAARRLAGLFLRSAPLALALAFLQLGASGALLAADSPNAEARSLGDRIHEHFRVWIEDETIRLRPIESDTAIKSIELEDGDDEVTVNGKAFSGDELRAFLGKDGELIAELAALDSDARRGVLGLNDETPETDDDAEESGHPSMPAAPGAPPPPPVPGMGHIRIESDGDDRVSFGRSIEIRADESTGDAVCIGCSITVAGEVEGDAVAVGGTVHIEGSGHVMGNAVGVGGKVRLESGATVGGDAVAVGGSVQVEEGATVEGQKSTVGWGGGWGGHKGGDFSPGWFLFDSDAGELFWSLLRALFLALLCCTAALFARGAMERTSRRLTDEPWKAIFAGLLTQLLFFPLLLFVTVILAVSIIGIPLLVLVPVAVLALLVSMMIGFAAVAQSLGRWAAQRFGWRLTGPFLPVLAGVAMIQGVTIVARIVGLPGGFLGLFAFVLLALGFFLKFAAWTMGLGAMTLSLLGRDWQRPDSGPVLPAPTFRDDGYADGGRIPTPPPPPPAPAADESAAAVEPTGSAFAAEAVSDEATAAGGTAVTQMTGEREPEDEAGRKA
jgi:hypothetical protein